MNDTLLQLIDKLAEYGAWVGERLGRPSWEYAPRGEYYPDPQIEPEESDSLDDGG